MAGQRGATAAGEQPESIRQSCGDLLDGQRTQPRGGQLDRERQTIEPTDDLDDRSDRLGVDREIRADGGGPIGEQARGRIGERLVSGRVGGRLPQRRHDHQRLTGDGERFAARAEDSQSGATGQEVIGDLGGRVEQVLAVVQDDHRRLIGERVDQAIRGVAGGQCLALYERRLAQAHRAEHGLRHVGRVGDRRELGEPDAVRDVEPLGRLARQPGLAGATGPDERHESPLVEQLADPCELLLATDEAGERGPQVVRPHGWLSIVAQDREVHRPQLVRRVDTELVGQARPGPLETDQRLRRSPGLAEGPDVQGRKPLAQRVGGDQLLELGDRCVDVTEFDGGLEAVARCFEVQLVSAGSDGRADHIVAGCVAPELGRGGEVVGRAPRITRPQRRTTRTGQPLESIQVEIVGLDVEAVPALIRTDPVGLADHPSQPGYQ